MSSFIFLFCAGGLAFDCGGPDQDRIVAEARGAITVSPPATLMPLAPDSRARDQFGISLAVSGNTAVISGSDAINGVAGGAFVFQKAAATWSQLTSLAVPDASGAANWGAHVAISGGRIAVTSLSGDGSGTGGGVYTFVGSGSNWTFEERIAQPAADFGRALALSGDTLVAANYTTAWVYVRANGRWMNQATFVNDPPSQAIDFGWAAALDADRLAIAAPYEDVNGVLDAGAVYVYDRTGSTWSAPTRLVAPDPAISDNLGTALALEGDTLVAGAMFNVGGGSPAPFRNGRVLVFTKQGSVWQAVSFPGLDRTAGESVAISGRRVAYGTSGERLGSYGAVHFLERTGGIWSAVAQELPSPVNIDSEFGWSVGLLPDGLLVGGPAYAFKVTAPGAVFAYGLNRLLKEVAEACAGPGECETGFCVDGVCCASACGGGDVHDCQACSRAAGGTQDGACTSLTPAMAGIITCRPASGVCDLAETCVAGNTSCPADAPATDGTSCDDGLVCNGVSSCQSGTCRAAPAPVCPDDDDPCTTATCAEPAGCRQVPVPNCVPPGMDGGADAPDAGVSDGGASDAGGSDGGGGAGGAGAGGAGASNDGSPDTNGIAGATGSAGTTGGGGSGATDGCGCAASGTASGSPLLIPSLVGTWLVSRARRHRRRR